MIVNVFVLRRNQTRVSSADITHVVSNIWKVQGFVNASFNSNHWAVVIYNGPHTSRDLASHSTVFGFNQVSPYEFGQSWGAHIFQDGTTDVFFDAKRDLFYDCLIPVAFVFPGFIAHTLYFTNNTVTYF